MEGNSSKRVHMTVRYKAWYKFTDVSKLLSASIIRAIFHRPNDCGSNNHTKRRYITEDSHIGFNKTCYGPQDEQKLQ